MRGKYYKNKHAMYRVQQSVILYSTSLNAVLVIVVECGDVGMAASGIYDVDANSPNMATPTVTIQSPTRRTAL